MEIERAGEILAVIALDPSRVSGGAPIFFAENNEQQFAVALILARILGGTVHDLENGVCVVTRH
ncbi:MAG: hypothetical protein GX335_05325 [Firmicutes bacterium]|nr:hypothetical protein [Bacillota bacterium]